LPAKKKEKKRMPAKSSYPAAGSVGKFNELTGILSSFYALSQTINQSLDLGETLTLSLESAIETLKADSGHIRLIDEETDELVLIAHRGLSPAELARMVARRKMGEGSSWQCVRSEKPLIQEKPLENSTGLKQKGRQCSITIPLISKGRIIGTMSLQQRNGRRLLQEEIELFSHIGNQIGVAIDNARLHKNLLESEKKYKALFETFGDALFVLDLDGKFNLVNHAIEEITGFSRQELIGRHFKSIVAPLDLNLVQELFDSGYENFSRKSVEIRILDKKDEEHIIELLQVASRVETSGETTGYLITARDLTAKKKTEEKLLQTAKLQSLGEMASGIAHDFNNILMVILGRTELLLHEVRDESIVNKLKIIERAALDGSKTVMKIGDFTRAKPKDAEFQPVDLHAVIDSALEFTSSRWKDVYQKDGHPLEVKLKLDEIPSLPGNESELREAFINIILNSLDAMPRGGTLEIESRFLNRLPEYQDEHQIKPDGFVLVKVADSGIGMDDQTRRKIFDPFFSTKGVKGIGLGLSTAYGIIKRHNGEMKVESQKGIGTSLLVYLPVIKPATAALKALEAPEGKKRSARILVVDDDQTNLDFLCELLQKLGHEPVAAPDGEAGRSRFKTEGPWDIVFSDLGMPGISGWELVSELKKLDPDVPAVLITGWGLQLQEEEIKAKKVDYVLSKPFKIKEIMRIIDRTLQQRGPTGKSAAAQTPAAGHPHD